MLAYPLSLALLLCVFALCIILLRHTRTGCTVLLLAVAWLYLCSTAPVADFLMERLERDYPPRAMSVIAKADVIVLLGGAVRGDTHMSSLADINRQADRIVHAAALFKAGKAPVILVTGGGPENRRSEARMTRDILEVMGVPRHAILLENRSRDTHDNAVYSAVILKNRRARRILLVTSAFHMRRAQALFEAQDLQVITAPTDFQRLVAESALPRWLPEVGNLARTTHALHELLGYQVYRWRGWL